MRIAAWKRITKTDIPDLPEWAETIVDLLNAHLQAVTSALSANLTFADNMSCEIRTLEVPHDTVFSVELQRLKRNPIGVLLLGSSFFEYRRLAWKMSETKPLVVDVRIDYDTQPPLPVTTVTLLFLGG